MSFNAMHFHFRDTVTNVDVSPEDMRSIIEVIADTGKFWY
jgi:serine/threonine-protein phosphatase 4 regulatory subunit 2